MSSESHEEIRHLRNTVRDLVAFSTLPAIWAGRDAVGVARSFAEVLLSTLSLHFVLVRFRQLTGDVEIGLTKSGFLDSTQIQNATASLTPLLIPGCAEPPHTIPDPVDSGEVRVAVARFGLVGNEGIVIACSHRGDFPSESERLLLSVGANQTATVLQRKRAEQLLVAQSEWLKITLSSIGDAVIATDVDGRVTFLNGVAESLTGWVQADGAGQPLPEVFHIVNEHTRLPGENPALRALREGVTVGLANHTILISRNGHEFSIDDSAAPIKDASGQTVGAVLVFRDITEKRQADQALRRKEAELTDFVENATVGLHWVGHDGTILWANRAEMDLLGYTREEYIGHNIAEFHVDEPVIEDILCRLTNNEQLNGYEARMRCKDESVKHVSINSSVLWEDGRFIHTRCFTRDVTERKRSEEDRARLAAIVDSSEDAIISKSLDGIILSWNTGAERLFGYPSAEAIGKPITLIIPPDRLQEEREIIGHIRMGEPVEHFETVRVTKNGKFVDISLSVSPLRNASGHVIGASKVARDITQRKRADELLRDADRRKDDFLALLAHELRNPLAPIRNGLQVMRIARNDTASWERTRAMMERQLTHMVRLIDDLLDISRISRNKMELRRMRLALSDAIAIAVETARPVIDDAGHELIISLPKQPILLDADLTRLSQVVANLLTNSAKYTERGGKIWLSAAIGPGTVFVSVKDNGIGIPAASLRTIFDMFSQVDRSMERNTGGLGIGLALVKGLVEMHGGTVNATSAGEGKGSIFTVMLPTLKEAVTPIVEREAIPLSSKSRILVVDDNRDGAESLAEMLLLLGNEVDTAHDGLEAVEKAEQFKPEIILMDVGMPKLNGLDATRRIRESSWGKEITVIALTGWGMESDKGLSKEAGCNGHLVKPVDLADLQKLLNRVQAR